MKQGSDDLTSTNPSRRKFLKDSALTVAALALAPSVAGNLSLTGATSDYKINIFSKNLQWLGYPAMASLAAEMGFDGIDLTVRSQGHVLPERVEQDLPTAVKAIRSAGLEVYMMTTAITSADEPYAQAILNTAAALGINSYRMGWINYEQSKTVDEDLSALDRRLEALEALNKKLRIRGEYQNHSGSYVGSPVWDVAMLLKKDRKSVV